MSKKLYFSGIAISFVLMFAISVICTLLYVNDFIPQSYKGCVICSGLAIIGCAVVMVLCEIVFVIRDIKPSYCIWPFVIFSILALVMALLKFEPIYTWLFLPFKLFGFGRFPRAISALIISVAFACVYVPVPFIFKAIKK